VDEVFRSPRITDSVRVALLALVRDMDESGRVSVPRVELAARLARGKARVSERLQAAVDAGFLSRVSAGKKGSTAVYAATLPKGSGGVDPKPDPETEGKGPEGWTQSSPGGRTESEHFGSGLQDANNADTVRTSGPKEAKKGPEGGDATSSMGVEVDDLLPDITGEGLFDSSVAPRKPKPSRRSPETLIPDDFSITEEMRLWAKGKGITPAVDLDYQTELFINHAHTHERRCRNWVSAWKNWMLKAKFEPLRNQSRNGASNFAPGSGQRNMPRPDEYGKGKTNL
jgi:hypothetical protein